MFPTLDPFATLPSGEACAARVRPTPEVRPDNHIPNHTAIPAARAAASAMPRVTGDFVGTTDEILQWAACKWGIDVDILRGQAFQESGWQQRVASHIDISTNPAHCGAAQPYVNGSCSESIGITQVRSRFYLHYDFMAPWESTSYNVEVLASDLRHCYEGRSIYLDNKYPSYGPGDMWGCVGRWFSGEWYTDSAHEYIGHVRHWISQRAWEDL